MKLLNSFAIVKITLQKKKQRLWLLLGLVVVGLSGYSHQVWAQPTANLTDILSTDTLYLIGLVLSTTTAIMITLWFIRREKRAMRQFQRDKQLLLNRIETLERRNAELERVNQLKSEFFANMSHELRTPLNAVLGITEALSEQIYGTLNDSQVRFLKRIYRNGEKLLNLISDIVDLSKIQVGRIQLRYEQFNLHNFCATSLAYIKEKAHKKNIQIILEPEQDTGLGLISADSRRLKQILFNLLNNAVKFSPEGSAIGLRVSVTTATNDNVGSVQLSVWDKGTGISETQQAHIFEPFTERYHQLEAQYKGTGLGLALVKELVELHQGTVNVESEVGQGSCFTVTLPNPLHGNLLDTGASEVVETKESATEKSDKPLILLVEDTPDNVENVRDFLTHYGYHVVVAYSGTEAIAFVKQTIPNLILMDIQMPGMDGFTATQHIRRIKTCEQLPIIALTAMTLSGERERCLAAGMDDYVGKPVHLRALLNIIKLHLHI